MVRVGSILPWDLPQAKTWGSLGDHTVIHALTVLRTKQWTSWAYLGAPIPHVSHQMVGKLDKKNCRIWSKQVMDKCLKVLCSNLAAFTNPRGRIGTPSHLSSLISDKGYKSPMLLEAFQLCSTDLLSNRASCKLKNWKMLTSSLKFDLTRF